MVVPLRLDVDTVELPCALLFSEDVTPADVSVWLRLRLEEDLVRPRSQASRKLAKRTGRARSTVMLSLKRLELNGWLIRVSGPGSRELHWKTACPDENSPVVRIPVDLIRDVERVRPQEILCYGFLQVLSTFNGLSGKFRWRELRDLTGLHLRTIRRAVRGLAETFWVSLKQENRRAPVTYRLQHADMALANEVNRRLEKRIERSDESFVGEALMHEALALIVALESQVVV